MLEPHILDGVSLNASNVHKDLLEFIFSSIRGETLDEKIASFLGVLELEDLLGELLLLESLRDVELLSIDFLLMELFDGFGGSVRIIVAYESQKSFRCIGLF